MLAACFAAMETVFGPDRPAAMCRELTKKFEEVRRGTVQELAAYYAEQPAPKGEAVVVLGPPQKAAASQNDIDAALRAALKSGSVKDAASEVAEMFNLSRKPLYKRAIELSNE